MVWVHSALEEFYTHCNCVEAGGRCVFGFFYKLDLSHFFFSFRVYFPVLVPHFCNHFFFVATALVWLATSLKVMYSKFVKQWPSSFSTSFSTLITISWSGSSESYSGVLSIFVTYPKGLVITFKAKHFCIESYSYIAFCLWF